MMETAFQIANALVLPQWLLMIFAPRWSVTQWLVRSYLIPVLLACMYAYFLFSGVPLNFSDFGSEQNLSVEKLSQSLSTNKKLRELI